MSFNMVKIQRRIYSQKANLVYWETIKTIELKYVWNDLPFLVKHSFEAKLKESDNFSILHYNYKYIFNNFH